MILLLCVLLSCLMFSLGVWLGFRGAPVPVADKEESRGAQELVRKPASSDEGNEGSRPGAELRKEFQQSKQNALAHAMVVLEDLDEPRSTIDASAHQKATQRAERTTAAVEEVKVSDRVLELRAAEDARAKAGPPPKVEGLFERSVDSVSDFKPTIGSFTVHLESYATKEEAHNKVRQLRKAGFLNAYTQKTKTKAGDTWFRVAVGSYPNPIFAKEEGKRVKRRALARDFIVRKVNN